MSHSHDGHSHDHQHAHEHAHSHDEDDEEDAAADAQHFQEVVRSFQVYMHHGMAIHNRMVRDYQALGSSHRALLKDSYPSKIKSMQQCIEGNTSFLNGIIADIDLFGKNELESDGQPELMQPSADNIDKVHSTLRQFVRDWSAEGAQERARSYTPLIEEVERRFPLDKGSEVNKYRVLVPGCGLGRLVWEFAHRGYAVQGNEFSYHMLLASNWVLNQSDMANPARIYPFAVASCNRAKLADQFQCITVPDVVTANLPAGVDMSMNAGEFCLVYNGDEFKESFDVIAAPFFVDTAHNVIDYMETILHALKPGGIWINLGPLLWHYVDQHEEHQIELSLEELLKVARKMGFEIEMRNPLVTSYSADAASMMQTVYNCAHFVAVKPSGGKK